MRESLSVFGIALLAIPVSFCGVPDSGEVAGTVDTVEDLASVAEVETESLVAYSQNREVCDDRTPLRKALFGDLHMHTTYSFDAFLYGVRTFPEDAYRYAKGEEIPFLPLDENGEMAGTARIDRPLDFVAVTDHAEFLGEWQLCNQEDSEGYATPFCEDYRANNPDLLPHMASIFNMTEPVRLEEICGADGSLCVDYLAAPWQDIIEAAEEANDSTSACSFTALIGYEYTGTPEMANYHRNVIFRNNNVPVQPVSYIDAPADYRLWRRLDEVCQNGSGCDYLTIPHNTNLSNGALLTPYRGMSDSLEEKLEYSRMRLASEPLVEIFQHKGGSECVNGLAGILGEPDELCNMEQLRPLGVDQNDLLSGTIDMRASETGAEPGDCGDQIGSGGMRNRGCVSKNDFYRTALLTGLEEEQATGMNPVKLGAIASTDTHMSTPGAASERLWQGHTGKEWDPASRVSEPPILPTNIYGNPGGLAGVWAVENSRDAIFDALQRREVFGTSGPRIRPRFFGAWDLDASACDMLDMVAHGYDNGVPMGGDLPAESGSGNGPVFIAAAWRDPADDATPLQKIQVVKGWIDGDGQKHYRVFDVAGTSDSSAGVDLATGERYGEGHAQLCAVFQDPDFDAALPAYYYLRAVENPSPRWSLVACLGLQEDQRPSSCSDPVVDQVIQEQAWTSPIWYTP